MNYNEIKGKSHLKFQIQRQPHFLFLLRSLCLCAALVIGGRQDDTGDPPAPFIPSFSDQTLIVLANLSTSGHVFLGKRTPLPIKMKHDPLKPLTVVPFP